MTTLQSSLPGISEKKLVPELPTDRWFWGHLLEARKGMLDLFMRGHREVGSVVRMRFLSLNVYAFHEPEDIHHILVKNASNYRKETKGYEKLRLLLGNGLVTSEGSFWRRQRRIAQPAFQHKYLEKFALVMSQATYDMTQQWEQKAVQGEEVDLAHEMMRLTLRIAGETLLSTDISQETDKFGSALAIALERFNYLATHPLPKIEYVPLPGNIRFWRAKRALNQMTWKLIQERRASPENKSDLLSMFMTARDEETGEQMSDKQLLDEVLTMLGAGHETTANALSWSLYMLSQHPEIREKMAEEVDRVLGDRLPTMADLKQLTYTKQVFQESIRLYPPVWALARKAVEDDVIGGYHIPAGSYLFFSPYAVHRHSKYWENPEEFNPERFTPEALQKQKSQGHSKFAYIPFSQGQRKCIGDHFAMMEGVLVLAILARRFQWSLAPNANIELEASLTLQPKHGMPMHLHKRSIPETSPS